MGLADAEEPVDVDFYLEDPEAGGTLIASATTDSTITAQSSEDVIVEWVIPEATSLTEERIYVVLDADGRYTNEIHTDNHVGWAPAVAYGVPTGKEGVQVEAAGTHLLQPAYPNPFTSTTMIALELQEPAHVSLKVYDVLGREVARLADGGMPSGKHRFEFRSEGLAPGIYFYTARARTVGGHGGTELETRRLVLVR